MCGLKLRDKPFCVELRQRSGIENKSVPKKSRLQRYGHVLRKDDDDWVKKCVTLEVEGARQSGERRMKTWNKVVDMIIKDLHAEPSDAMDRS